jgi:LacI family transcriptional regulator
VVIDDHLGAYKITEHLIEQGCKRIAHFTSPKKINIYKERLRGYIEALSDYGLPFIQELVVESNMEVEGGRESTVYRQQKAVLSPELVIRQSSLKVEQ